MTSLGDDARETLTMTCLEKSQGTSFGTALASTRSTDLDSVVWVDFSDTPELHVAICPIFVHPFFELCALNPILLFALFLSKLQLFSCFGHFFRQGAIIELHVIFRVVFARPNPKSNPTTNP